MFCELHFTTIFPQSLLLYPADYPLKQTCAANQHLFSGVLASAHPDNSQFPVCINVGEANPRCSLGSDVM